jgi:hypothetical protein
MKMPHEVNKEMMAVCGINCLVCSAHLNKKRPCPGCRADVDKHFRKSCVNCLIKQCAFDQELHWCFECEQFPCSRIKNINKRYTSKYDIDLIQNGLEMKEDCDRFLVKQKKLFTCNNCGGVIDLHHKRCCECKNK